MPALKNGEGYLLVAVDTDTFLVSLHLNRLGSMLGAERLDRIGEGRSLRVLAVPAGEYQWARVDATPPLAIGHVVDVAAALRLLGTRRYDIKDMDTSRRFRVEPGKLNYPGDLHLRFHALGGALSLSMPNRGERTLAMFEARHPAERSDLPFRYAGEQADPYWTLRSAAQAAFPADDCPDDLDTLPQGQPSGFDLFRAEEIDNLALSPEGDLILETAYRQGQYQANVIDPASGDVLTLYRGSAAVSEAQWAGRRKVVIELRFNTGVTDTNLFTFNDGRLPGQQPARLRFPVRGFVVNALPNDEDTLLYGVFRPSHSDPLQIFRIDVSRHPLHERQFEARKRIDRKLENDRAWFSDQHGQLRLAVVETDDTRQLMYRPDGRSDFSALRSLAPDTVFATQWLAPDGSIYALSNEGRDQVELVRLDPATPDRLETVHAVAGIDLSGVETSGMDGRIVGVRYYEAGQARSHFFDEGIRDWQARLATSFPGQYVEPIDIDAGHGQAIIMVSSDTSPPSYYHYDVGTSKATSIGDGAPWLRPQRFVNRRSIDVQGDGSRPVQALLALPESDSLRPLLLMPHGGPFFVQDVLRFDRDVQYWATRGFAVLQINFRGSYGFGVQHLIEGFAGFGRQIEDDIVSALRHVLAEHGQSIDQERICSLGASYGGYSSLMLTLREPALIRCAVSIAGPTDLPLLFMSSDWNHSRASQNTMRRVLGDPDDPALRSHSPLYRAGDFSRPVMLIHGTDDRRVDVEHAARLATLLDQHHKPFEAVHLEGMGHGPQTIGQHVCMMGRAEQFIRANLDLEVPPAANQP